jgi:hypothetical protein
MSNFAVGNFRPNNELARNPPKSATPPDRSLFRLGDALLETAIAVTCVRIGHARNEQEHEQAFADLESLRSQRESRGFVSSAAIAHGVRAQLRACIDNQIQDVMHEQMDAERSSGGQRLDEFLGSQR